MAKESYPWVSIIIVTYNSQKYISDCLKTVFKTDYKHYEVIVVDNKSSDSSIKIVSEFKNVRLVISDKNLGYAGGNNLGAKYAKGKYLIVLNPDTQVSKNWLQPLVDIIKTKSDIAICQPKIMLLAKQNCINLTGKLTHYLGFEYGDNYLAKDIDLPLQEITSVSGSAFLINSSVFKKIHGFDNDFFMYYEDGDLSWRIRSLGLKILLVPQSVVYHDYKFHPEENYQKAKSKFYLLERNRLLMIIKNYSVKTLILLIPSIIFMEVGMHVYFITKGWWLEKWKGYLWLIKHFRGIIIKRRLINEQRLIPDRLISKDYTDNIKFEEFNNILLTYVANPILKTNWGIIKKIL